jgi:hypothetical protein
VAGMSSRRGSEVNGGPVVEVLKPPACAYQLLGPDPDPDP